MLLVILGAGASYDSVPTPLTDTRTVPLAKDLYADTPEVADVLRRLSASRSIVLRMRKAASEGTIQIEQVLGDFTRTAITKRDPQYLQDVIAIRFFLRQIISDAAQRVLDETAGLTNYLALVNSLHDWMIRDTQRVAFVSFNYDTLLETAVFDRFGTSFQTVESYLNARMPIIKPHGSVNWVQRVPISARPAGDSSPYMHTNLIRQAPLMDIENPGNIEPLIERQIGVGQDDAVLPAIAAPITGKDSFLLPAGHETALSQLLNEARGLLIVGWLATEDLFLDLCESELFGHHQGIPSMVVTYGSAIETIANFPHVLTEDHTRRWEDGFGSFLSSGEQLTAFLEEVTAYSRERPARPD